jgi:hypothetical protein
MAIEAALFDDDQPLQPRHALENPGGHRAAGHSELGLRIFPQQMVQQPGGQHRVAQPRGGDEKDAHARLLRRSAPGR